MLRTIFWSIAFIIYFCALAYLQVTLKGVINPDRLFAMWLFPIGTGLFGYFLADSKKEINSP